MVTEDSTGSKYRQDDAASAIRIQALKQHNSLLLSSIRLL